MWGIPRLYILACSNSVQLVPIHPIAMSILFHHYKELTECMTQVQDTRCGWSKYNNYKRWETHIPIVLSKKIPKVKKVKNRLS